MLKKLSIEQFVIIDKLDLDIQPGLTILTGDTGAGKSILLGAMGLILGGDPNPASIRQGSNKSVIEAVLAPPEGHPVWNLLKEHNLVDGSEKEFTIHRTIVKEGEGAVLLNNKTLELELLKEIGTYLVEIHGQFANQSITDPENQLTWLDMSGEFPPEILANVANSLRDVKRLTKELEEEKIFLARHTKRTKQIETIVNKFDSFDMKEGFIEELEKEHERLLIAKETSEAFQAILSQLISGNGVVTALATANQTLERQENVEKEKVEKLAGLLEGALKNARDAVKEMGELAPEYDIDTAPLRRCQEILKTLREISLENKVPYEDLTDFYLEMSTKLARIRAGREKLTELEDGLRDAKAAYREHAHILTEKRIEAGKELDKAITAELPPLKLNKAEFEVRVEEKPDSPWTERGFNEVTFTARMNPGMPFSPISDTASGGELARMILALKVILQKVQTTPTLVFDEVDTGIGGPAAAAVGERLAQLAEKTQVLVITHSPQVASRGDLHLHVSKKTDGVTTTSTVNQLVPDQRINEISRMLAGDETTAESNAAAKRLLDEASAAASVRNKQQSAQGSPAA